MARRWVAWACPDGPSCPWEPRFNPLEAGGEGEGTRNWELGTGRGRAFQSLSLSFSEPLDWVMSQAAHPGAPNPAGQTPATVRAACASSQRHLCPTGPFCCALGEGCASPTFSFSLHFLHHLPLLSYTPRP